MTDIFRIKIPKNIGKYLADVFGGIWKRNGISTWKCDDGIRVVQRIYHVYRLPFGTSYWLYGNPFPVEVTFNVDTDFCEQSKVEAETFGDTVCITCDLYEPHVCLESSTRCEEMYKSGKLKKEPNSCSKWLCNCGTCPHSKPRIDRFYKISMGVVDYVVDKDTIETKILTERDLENVPEHLREMVRIQNNKNKQTIIPINTYPIAPLMHEMLAKEPCSYLPTEEITFNPSDEKSIDSLLRKYGPECLCEIAEVLTNAAVEDITLPEDIC
jgi:hypothetical protein